MNTWSELLEDLQKHIPSSVECEIKMMHSKIALTRFATSHIHQNVDDESAHMFLPTHKNGKSINTSKNTTALKNSKDFVKEALDSIKKCHN